MGTLAAAPPLIAAGPVGWAILTVLAVATIIVAAEAVHEANQDGASEAT